MGTLGNGWALCGAGENETDRTSFDLAEVLSGESAGDEVKGPFVASAEAELGGLFSDSGLGGADTVGDIERLLERNPLGIESISLRP